MLNTSKTKSSFAARVIRASCAGGILVLGQYPTVSFSAPEIFSISGELVEGSQVTVSGRGFGVFGGKIVSWDDFEDQEIGAPIHSSESKIGPRWTGIYDYSGPLAVWSNARPYSGGKSAEITWNGDTIRAFGWANTGQSFDRLFISYWRYMTGAFSSESNHKQFYLYGNDNDFPQLMPLIPQGGSSWGLYNNGGGKMLPSGTPNSSYSFTNNINTKGWSWSNTEDKYQRWDFWFVLNNPTLSNGVVRAWVDGELGIENTGYPIRYSSGEFEDFRLGHMAREVINAKAWFDDLYIATTQARVELCASSRWSDCTHKDIQIIDQSSWSDGSLTFTIRAGGQTDIRMTYLYVIDKDGSVNTMGFPLDASAPREPRPNAPVFVD